MYEPGTILAMREPQSTDDTPYPYDRVQVVGQSPVSTSAQAVPYGRERTPRATSSVLSPTSLQRLTSRSGSCRNSTRSSPTRWTR